SIQLGIDKKIYFSRWNSYTLGVIETPDSSGYLCNISLFGGLDLKDDKSLGGLPQWIWSATNVSTVINTDISINSNCDYQVDFSVGDTHNIKSVLWDFGDPSSGQDNESDLFTSSHLYTTAGEYLVRLVLEYDCELFDTLVKLIN